MAADPQNRESAGIYTPDARQCADRRATPPLPKTRDAPSRGTGHRRGGPDAGGLAEGGDRSGSLQLQRALAGLPPGMRAAVVFRHVHELSVAETAEALGCSQGNVKSQTARGLERLRAALATAPTLSRRSS